MKTFLFIFLQYIAPQHLISRIIGKIASSDIPWIKNVFISRFIDKYNVNMHEAKVSDWREYTSFNDFFHRELRDDARDIDETQESIVSPADGAFSQLGAIKNGRIFQAKGQTFSAAELLGGDESLASEFADGEFATIYLSPKDYHRVHMPITGTLRSMTHIPGALFSVNPVTADNVPRLFARNERVSAIFDTEIGPVAVVLVGAMIVASIDTVWAGQIAPTGKEISTTTYNAKPIKIQRGEEMGRFKLGSTVVLLFPKSTIEWKENIEPSNAVFMGNKIASIVKSIT